MYNPRRDLRGKRQPLVGCSGCPC